ncbi:MAG: hypothetical protein F6K10_18205 [Moorea sp. SIO2B7]|nr:hypothetical protein [Moorena sp. SIO2B7]
MELWDEDYIHAVAQAQIAFMEDQSGLIGFGYIEGSIDYRIEENKIQFSWLGEDEQGDICGRGYAKIDGDKMEGKIFIHEGDKSTFIAIKDK